MMKILLTGLLLLLSGCSGLLTSNQNVDQFYTVNAIKDYPNSHQSIDAVIVIQTPSVAKGLDNNKIMLMHSPQRQDYYAYARWSSTLSNMVQTSLIESFENSEVLERVSSDQGGLRPDYLLLLEVYDFQAEYTQSELPPTVHIKLVAKLVEYPTRSLLASFTAETFQQADENELADIVRTFDQAFKGAQALLIEETVDYFGNH